MLRSLAASRLLFILLAFGVVVPQAAAVEMPRVLLKADVKGKSMEAQAIRWSEAAILLLARDGKLHDVKPADVKNYQQITGQFRSFSAGEMRDQIQRELGPKYEVTGTGHYLVAHPAGQGQKWSERFEQLYRSMLGYMNKRGVSPRKPEFPMVALVFASQAEFADYARREGHPVNPGLLGYYSLMTNRIALFDVGDGKATAADWRINAATVVHEAAHQTAFNTGVHSRLAPPPRWLAEGLGTLFEERGIYDGQSYPQLADRINRDRLRDFRAWLPKRPQGHLAELITSDRPFVSNPLAAYGESWAFTFFLVETQPADYAKYILATANRSTTENYGSVKRMEEFSKVFGKDLKMIEARFLRYLEGVK